MLERSKCRKYWVWDGDGPNPKNTQLIVFEILHDGSCWCVVFGYEKRFVNYESYANIRFDHCEEITEPKYRAFHDGEMPEEWRDYWYRGKRTGTQSKCVEYRNSTGFQICLLHSVLLNNELFEDYEVQKEPGGEWGIVGVEE